MNEVELTFSPYTIRLKTPFETSKWIVSERKGFIITLKSESEKTGIGDAAPFPELGSESFEETEEALSKVELKINIDLNDIRKSLKYTLRNYEAFPALRHGLEQALVNLICIEKDTTINELLKFNLKKEIYVNASIGFLSPSDAVLKTRDFRAGGFNTIKIKVGRENFNDDLAVVKAVRDANGSNVKIRVDVNGKWNLEQAVQNLNRLREFNIEFAAQPVNSVEDFIELRKHTSIKIAADESIRNLISARTFINNKAVDMIIIKPMLTGGLIPALEMAELAEKNNIIPVLTSSLESAIGKSNVVIAAASVKPDIAHGIAESNYYEQDIAEDRFPVVSGKIRL